MLSLIRMGPYVISSRPEDRAAETMTCYECTRRPRAARQVLETFHALDTSDHHTEDPAKLSSIFRTKCCRTGLCSVHLYILLASYDFDVDAASCPKCNTSPVESPTIAFDFFVHTCDYKECRARRMCGQTLLRDILSTRTLFMMGKVNLGTERNGNNFRLYNTSCTHQVTSADNLIRNMFGRRFSTYCGPVCSTRDYEEAVRFSRKKNKRVHLQSPMPGLVGSDSDTDFERPPILGPGDLSVVAAAPEGPIELD